MHLSAPIRSHEPRVLSPPSYRTSESTIGLVDHLLHSRPTGTRPVHFPAVRPTFGHLVTTFSSSPLSPKPSLTCIGPSLGTSLLHLRPPHISWLSHHSQVCCSTTDQPDMRCMASIEHRRILCGHRFMDTGELTRRVGGQDSTAWVYTNEQRASWCSIGTGLVHGHPAAWHHTQGRSRGLETSWLHN